MFSSRILIPLYAEANDGIYKINRRKILAKYGPRTILLSLAENLLFTYEYFISYTTYL